MLGNLNFVTVVGKHYEKHDFVTVVDDDFCAGRVLKTVGIKRKPIRPLMQINKEPNIAAESGKGGKGGREDALERQRET